MAGHEVERITGVATTARGQIIFLNGVSSSGKTTIAQALLPLLDRPYFHMSVDAFGAMRSPEQTAALTPDALRVVLRRTRAGFHRAVAGMADAGNDIVMDHVLSERWRLLDCLGLFAHHTVVFVGVHCSADELTRRERARGDRQPGQGAAQLATVHGHGLYDLACSTEFHTARDCARQIRTYVDHPGTPSAFDQLRSTLRHELAGGYDEA
jgi:chloramphenicol 3-O phosphotransferase